MLGLGLATLTGAASADDDITRLPLHGVTVHAHRWPNATEDRPLGDCTPPSDLRVCTALHRQIRKTFSRDDIGMLFGAATAYPEYLTSYSRVRDRYRKFLQELGTTDAAAVAIAQK